MNKETINISVEDYNKAIEIITNLNKYFYEYKEHLYICNNYKIMSESIKYKLNRTLQSECVEYDDFLRKFRNYRS